MQADTKTLKDILIGERRYIVPPYQRPYVWERDRQWAPLWADVEDTVGRLAESRAQAAAKGSPAPSAESATSPHFLGAIVLDQLSTPAGEIDRRAVVDGQQRLTTTQLLLRGVLDALAARDVEPKLRAQLAKLLRNDDDVVTSPETRWKLWPRRAEREHFERAMADQAPDPEEGRFAAARSFFADSTLRWLDDEHGPVDPYAQGGSGGRPELLVATLRGLLKLVVIDLDGIDDAQVIFEVLNARHTPLTAADLVKNLLFLRAETDGLQVEALYEQYWQQFDDAWWNEHTGTGHATRARQDWLLGDWLVARSAHPVSVAHLYGAAKTWIERSGEKIPDILESIHRYAVAFDALHGRGGVAVTPAEANAFRTIQLLKMTVANPLLLWLLTRSHDELPPTDRERAVLVIESFLVRRMAMKLQTRAYGSVFVEVLRAAADAHGAVADAIVDALLAAPHGYHWPLDAEVEDAFATSRAYGPGGINQPRLKLLLGAVDRHLRLQDAKTEPLTADYDSLTVEHVMPQAWREHWPVQVPKPELAVVAESERDRAVHRIGNLTLLTAALNPSVSNAAWTSKRGEIGKHSHLRLNQLLCEHDQWAEADIDARCRWLAREVCTVWPRLEPSAVTADPGEQGALTGADGSASGARVEPPERSSTHLLSDEDLELLHQRIWETATATTDDRGWRMHTAGVKWLLTEFGIEVTEKAGPHGPPRRDALERLVGNGLVERIGGGESSQTRAMWVRPPE